MNNQVEILVDDKPVKQYCHNGNVYIEAKDGTEYAIKVKNNELARWLAVITVDGVNVISGTPQGIDIGQGYIVNGGGSLTVKGYRSDLSSVGAFKFCKKGESYSNQVGISNNNGVIGVRIYREDITKKLNDSFKEMNKPWNKEKMKKEWVKDWVDEYRPFFPPVFIQDNQSRTANYEYTPSSATYSCSVQCCSNNAPELESPKFEMGSTWGKKIYSKVTYSEFDVGNLISETIIFYDTKENLESIGIRFKKDVEIFFPKAFGVFATPPKGWKG